MRLYGGCVGLICWIPDHRRYAQLPVTRVSAKATVFDMTAEVQVTQTYTNPTPNKMDVRYVFPLDSASAVKGFEASINGRVIQAKLKTKEAAKAEYDQAVEENKHAFLLEASRDDVFQMSVGNLGGYESATIVITYVTELAMDAGRARFYLPTSVSPRYSPDNSISMPDGSAIKPYLIDINVDIHMSSDLLEVTSPTHPISSEKNGLKGTARLSGDSTAMGKDFVLLLLSAHLTRPSAVVYTDPKSGLSTAALSMVMNADNRQVPSELIFLVDCSGSMQSGDQIGHARSALQLLLRGIPVGSYFNIVLFGSHHTSFSPSSVLYDDDSMARATEYVNRIAADMGGTEIFRPLEFIYNQPLHSGFKRQLFLLTDGQVNNEQAVIELVGRHSSTTRAFGLGIGDGVSHHLVNGVARAGRGTARFITTSETLRAKVSEQLNTAVQACITDVRVDWGAAAATEGGYEEQQKKETKSSIGAALASATMTAAAPVGAANVLNAGGARSFFSDAKVAAPASLDAPTSADAPVPRGTPGSVASLFPPARGCFIGAPVDVPPILQGNRFIIYAVYGAGTTLPTSVTVRGTSLDGPLELTVPLVVTTDGAAAHLGALAGKALIQEIQDSRRSSHGVESNTSIARTNATALSLHFGVASDYTSFVAIDEASRVVDLEPPAPRRPGGIRSMRLASSGMTRNMMMGAAAAPPPAAMSMRESSRPMPAMAAMPMMASMDAMPLKKSKAKKMNFNSADVDMDESADAAELLPSSAGGAPPPPPPSQPASSLMALIMLQRASGVVASVQQLCATAGVDEAALRAAFSSVAAGGDEQAALVFATLVWCALLKDRFAAERAEWELPVDKAMRFCAAKAADVNAWTQAAEKFVASA